VDPPAICQPHLLDFGLELDAAAEHVSPPLPESIAEFTAEISI
jgi:hypothetical protein